MRNRPTILFYCLIIVGIIIRVLSLFYNGMGDMNQYEYWGRGTLEKGLAISFAGIYFPFQYQIFEFCSYLVSLSNIDSFIIFKSINLLFECANLIVLYLIFTELNVSKNYLLYYWLHPWFLNFFSLGYIDCQFTLFILLFIYFSFKDSCKNFLFASFFLGIAFLSKPQVQIIILALFIFTMVNIVKKRSYTSILYYFFPIVLFASYSFYFYLNHSGVLGLANAYLNVSNVMPCLNANFLNVWFAIAFLLKDKASPIYSVSDQITLFFIPLKFIAIFIVIVLLVIFVVKYVTNKDNSRFHSLDIIFFASIIGPFVMTSAHENHLFLGSVLIIPFISIINKFTFTLSANIILFLQFVNMYGYYGSGKFNTNFFIYSSSMAFVFSIVSFLCFLVVVFHIFKLINHNCIQPSDKCLKRKLGAWSDCLVINKER